MLTGFYSARSYPRRLRRVEALVEVDGKQRVMVFLTHNLQSAAGSVAEHYRCRRQIECFSKQIKQTLRLCDFLSTSANAEHWQLWMALLCYVRRACEPVGGQFHAAVGGLPLVSLAAARPARAAGQLWDSRWQLSMSGPARTGVAAGAAAARSYGIASRISPRATPPLRPKILHLDLESPAPLPSKDQPFQPANAGYGMAVLGLSI